MKPKSTGARSQQTHAFGHASSIAEQLTLPGREFTAIEVLYFLISELVEEGEWPEVTHPWFKKAEPRPWSEADASLANVMIDKLHAFSDLHGLWLIEYNVNTGVPEKVYYGRRKGVEE
jgi:hypothetical protein